MFAILKLFKHSGWSTFNMQTIWELRSFCSFTSFSLPNITQSSKESIGISSGSECGELDLAFSFKVAHPSILSMSSGVQNHCGSTNEAAFPTMALHGLMFIFFSIRVSFTTCITIITFIKPLPWSNEPFSLLCLPFHYTIPLSLGFVQYCYSLLSLHEKDGSYQLMRVYTIWLPFISSIIFESSISFR